MARPIISVQAAIGPGTPATNNFIIGSSLIGGTDVIAGTPIVGQGTWVELGDRCSMVSTRRGRTELLEQYNAGTLAGLFDNTDGTLDPAWNAGPYSDAGVSTIRPMRAIRGVFVHDATEYPFYYGYADQWTVQPSYPEGGLIDVTATDAFKIFARIDPLEQSPVGAGDDTGARLNRILDLAEWATPLRDIDTGVNTHQSTTLAEPIATQLRLAADSERGDLYIDARGFPTFRNRLSRYTAARSLIVQWTFGDGDGEHNPSVFTQTNNDALVRNDVNVSRVGGSMITRRSATAEIPYLRSTFTRTDLTLADDIQVTDYAERVLSIFQTQEPRVASVTFEPDGVDTPEMWSMIVGARFGDRVACNLTHPYTGVRFVGDYFIEGINHDIPAEASGDQWRTTFALADASRFPTHPFIINASLIGGTDVLV